MIIVDLSSLEKRERGVGVAIELPEGYRTL
jgi:hypothetical protein